MASENKPIAKGEESNTHEATSGNHIVKEEVSIANGAELETCLVDGKIASENSSTTNVVSAGRGLKFLSLPPELRLRVYRFLLLEHRPLSTSLRTAKYQPYPSILNTCTLIRREAFPVMYGENFFTPSFSEMSFHIAVMHPQNSILNNRPITDAMQNIHIEARLDERRTQWNFLQVRREFAAPNLIVRGTLNMVFHVVPHHNYLFDWFGIVLTRFTNFRTIRFEFVPVPNSVGDRRADELAGMLWNLQRLNFEPIFGPAQHFRANGYGLEFHPYAFLNAKTSRKCRLSA